MIKRINKLFLILGVIIFNIVVIGCDEQNVIEDFQATYVETDFIGDYKEGLFKIVDERKDLIFMLLDDAPEKYDEVFFDNNSLLIFRIIEPSKEITSIINSYIIENDKITINVETPNKGDKTEKGYWWFILELTADDAEKIKNVKIVKNKEVIMEDERLSEIEKFTMQFDTSEEKIYWDGKVDVSSLDSIVIEFRNTKTYPDFKLKYLGIKEAIGYNYIEGPFPHHYYYKEIYREELVEFRVKIEVFIDTTQETELSEIIEKIEKLDFVKKVELKEK